MPFGITEAVQWLHKCNDRIQDQKQYLTELDQAIGDGDHGLNLARGFSEVVKKIEPQSYNDLGVLLKDVGMILLSKVGGASGPLYGTIFLKASTLLKDKSEASIQDLANAFSESLSGIQARGKAQINDKTMLDVWSPAVSYMLAAGENLNWQAFKIICKEKMMLTKELEAKKGRASYLGKRSVGHIDPGAASSYILLSSLADVCYKGALRE
jgi:phosphoenolpyruvate---glycerone phosphotransferase subunit DhaL